MGWHGERIDRFPEPGDRFSHAIDRSFPAIDGFVRKRDRMVEAIDGKGALDLPHPGRHRGDFGAHR